ncbi:hypothetical protein GCM10025857_33520 [Alicyclobacillus contaminans]|nr:hypothetical protein GCM10025857_33520 [Alicyclobacillus contaminans]
MSVADQSAGHIEVRGQVKADQWSVAAKVLEDAVKTHHSGERLDLAVIHGKVGGDSPGAVVSAQLHVVLPASMGVLALRSHNGSLNLDSVRAEELRLDTVNGSVTVHDSTFARLFVTTDNGRVEVYDSITTRCQSVYASAKSGTLRIHGKHPDVRMEGTARTAFGRIDIPVSRFEVVADEDARPTFVRFAEKNAGDGVHRMRVQLETRSGNIRISPAAADSPL